MDDVELCHYGVKGMKWGVRRKARSEVRGTKRANKTRPASDTDSAADKVKIKRAVKIGAAAVGTALAVYGGYKLNSFVKQKNIQLAAQKGDALIKQFMNENKITLKSGSFAGHISTYSGGKFVERTSRPMRNTELRTMARSAYAKNSRLRETALDKKNALIRDASKDTFGKAAKNVASYYLDRKRRA